MVFTLKEEVEEIDYKLSFFSPNNHFENRTREVLLIRLSEIGKNLKSNIARIRKQTSGLRVV